MNECSVCFSRVSAVCGLHRLENRSSLAPSATLLCAAHTCVLSWGQTADIPCVWERNILLALTCVFYPVPFYLCTFIFVWRENHYSPPSIPQISSSSLWFLMITLQEYLFHCFFFLNKKSLNHVEGDIDISFFKSLNHVEGGGGNIVDKIESLLPKLPIKN